MKKVIAWLLVLALTAAISIGATLAYLTDTDEDVNVMTLGNVKIDQLEYERVDDETANDKAEVQEFHDNKPLYPAVTDKDFDYTPGNTVVDWTQIGKDGYTSEIWNPEKINNELDKMVFVKNKGTYDAYVRTVFAFEAGNYETLDQFQKMMHLNLNDTDFTWEWIKDPVEIPNEEGTTTKYFVAVATYNKVLEPGALTEISLSQIALDKTATNEDVAGFGDTYHVLVKSQAIQTQGFDNATTALNEGFGEITATAVPFETDQPIKGIDVRSALRFYQGDETQPIHTQVTDVVFGLNKDYPEIVNNYDGTLFTDEQDVETYSYYVQDSGKYTVYFLANSKVNLPKDSSRLFSEMSKLTTVDTSNLSTARAELMNHLFFKCSALTDVDVSGFDTSKVTTMKSLFNACSKLTGVDVSKWDVSNVKDMSYMFRACNAMTEIDLSNWDVSGVQNMEYMFYLSEKLQKVDTTGWNTKSVTSTKGMFMNCYKLADIIGSGSWDLSSNANMYYMIQNNYELEYIDVSNWNCSNVTDMEGVFFNCKKLKTVEGLENWDTSSATTMYCLFSKCAALADADVSNFKTGNVEDMTNLFYGCHSLPEANVANWDTGKVKNFSSMFSCASDNSGSMLFTELAVENWNVSSAVKMDRMFYGCGRLTQMDLSKWDVSNVTTMYHMFCDCFNMVSYNFSGWNTASLVIMDGMFNDNDSLKVVDVSDFDTSKVQDFDQIFESCTELENIIGLELWDTSSGKEFAQVFVDTKLKELNLTGFNLSNAKYTNDMFKNNSELTTIYVSDNWNLDPAKLDSSPNMFSGNPKLTGANGTTIAGNPVDATYARVDTAETPGYLTHINDKPVTNP